MKNVKIHFENNQLVEALCDIQFEPNQNWDWTIPGLFYDKIKDKYPNKQEVKGFGMDFRFDSSKNKEFPEFHSNMINKIEGMQFLNKDKNRLLYLRENSLSMNILCPYKSWKEFKPRILEGLNLYKTICNPKGIRRIGIRYINDFKCLPPKFQIEDYFKYLPKFPDENQMTIGELLIKSSFPIVSEKKRNGFLNAILILNKMNLNKKEVSHLLDLDMIYSRNPKKLISIDEAELFIEDGHENIIKTFDSFITENMKKLIS